MPHYHYKAKKGPTETVQGELDAENEDAALGKISMMGLIPLKLEAVSAATDSASSSGKRENSQAVKGKVESGLKVSVKSNMQIHRKDFDIFTRQFAILLKANVPLLRIFTVLQSQTSDEGFRALLNEVQEKIRSGSSLSDALRQFPNVFSQLYVNMIESGEISGMLDVVMARLAEFSEKEAEMRAKIQSAMIYPIFLLCVGVVVIFVLLTFILPRLMNVFTDLGTELPAITLYVIRISNFCQAHWLWIVGGVTGLAALLKTQTASVLQKNVLDPLVLKLPVLGDLVKKSETSKFLRSLDLLYENGIPLFKAVEVASRTVENNAIRQSLRILPEKLHGGATLTQSLQQVPEISSFVTNMVSVGEESGKLGDALQETAAFYEQETNQVIKVATALIEPFMILVIGGVIGFIVIAMLLPIFEISAAAQ